MNRWTGLVAGLLILVTVATTTAEEAPLSFRLGLSRTHNADHDSVLVVATVLNTRPSALKTWGLLDYSGRYKPSAETYVRWSAIRDSSLAAATRPILRDVYTRLPSLSLIPRSWSTSLRAITLQPGEAFSDTLLIVFYKSDFDRWPGYFDVTGEFLMGAGPDTAGAVRLGRSDLRIAIPVP